MATRHLYLARHGAADAFGELTDVGRRQAGLLGERFARPAATETHEVLITHAFQVAWLLRHALDAPPARWLGLNSGNAALTVIEHRDGQPASVVLFNDMGHLPAGLRWTGFSRSVRP